MTPPTPPSTVSALGLPPISPASPSSAAFPMLPSYVMAQMQHIHRMATGGPAAAANSAFPPPPPLTPLHPGAAAAAAGLPPPPASPLFPSLPTTPDAVHAQMLKCRICHFETINPEVTCHITYSIQPNSLCIIQLINLWYHRC